MSLSLKRTLSLNIKNIPGWSTKRKLVIFSVDDYGNVRVASREARENMKRAGLDMDTNRFDRYDSLETTEDLAQLYETLTSVKDKNGRHASFTAFAMPANVDFEKMKETGYREYHYELLPETFKKLPGYEHTFDLWKEGIANKLLYPQFHGREHLNVKLLMELLRIREKSVMESFANRSYAGIVNKVYPTIAYTAAFNFNDFSENEQLKRITEDGLHAFEKVFGFKAKHFNAPGAREHSCLEETLKSNGIRYIDTDMVKMEHQGNGLYKKRYNYLGKRNTLGQTFIIRNCVLEPLLNSSMDWVDNCMAEIDIAFRWGKPANISSHRINFCGHIDTSVREKGLGILRELLKQIIKKWPDVEFMTSDELGDCINDSKG